MNLNRYNGYREDYLNKDLFKHNISVGDRVIVGMKKDVNTGIITHIEDVYDYQYSMLTIKMEDTEALVYRNSYQVIKINE